MASNIDITKPVATNPTTQSVRDNFATAKTEIEALQASVTNIPDTVRTFTKAQRSQIVALTPSSNVYTPDSSAGNFFSFTPVANFTLANPTNLPAAGITQSGSIFITQDATGSRTITFGNLYFAAGGISSITLSTPANTRDRIDYVIGPNGNIHISIAKDIKA